MIVIDLVKGDSAIAELEKTNELIYSLDRDWETLIELSRSIGSNI